MSTFVDKEKFGPWAVVTGASSGIGRDLVAFGRPYIANPDLVERLATGAPLAEIDWKTVYASGPRGYTDYPANRRAAAEGLKL
jgi:2,4-dienoyl-CoA reductase-like NADH-dependent reductase (Old Yellow Enzyme family)